MYGVETVVAIEGTDRQIENVGERGQKNCKARTIQNIRLVANTTDWLV